MKKTSIMIVDDHVMVREGLKQLLEVGGEFEVIAEASTGLECMQVLEKYSPDIIFMDVKMPGINGIETTRLVLQKYPSMKVIMLTIHDDEQYVTEAIEAGAVGFVLKKVTRDQLIDIISKVKEGIPFLDPSAAAAVFGHLRKKTGKADTNIKPRLTQRELEVLNALVNGHSDRGIGELLYISEQTVRSHLKSLYRKLDVSSRSQAVARALNDRLITPEDKG
jgi:DNA-binding NarL/FixJ family response regulator